MKVGVIGCGWVAHKHIPFIQQIPGAEIVGVVDNDPDRLRLVAQKYGIPHCYARLSDLLDSQRVDVVHILTPPFRHATLALEAIRNGVHVYIEKPVALDASEVKEILLAAKEGGVKVCPGYNYLFDPFFRQASDRIARGELGEIIHVESVYGINLRRAGRLTNTPDNQIHWSYELPGGIYQNYVSHPLYKLLTFTGTPRSTHVISSNNGILPQNLPDDVRAMVEGDNASGMLCLSFSCRPHQHLLRVFGSKRSMTIDWRTMTVIIHAEPSRLPSMAVASYTNVSSICQVGFQTLRNAANVLTKRLRPYEGMKALIAQFYRSIEEGSDPPVPEDLILSTETAAEEILKKCSNVHLDFRRRPSVQKSGKCRPTILVTGASGFVGSATVRRLVADGFHVRALVRKLSHIAELERLGVEIWFGDVRDLPSFQSAAEGVDIIVHLAAATGGRPHDYEETTVGGTRNLVEIAKASREIKHVIYISSMAVYDLQDCDRGQRITEDHVLERRPKERGLYSWSKLEAEKIVVTARAQTAAAWTILRPAVIIGQGPNGFLKSLGFSLGKKLRLIIGPGDRKLRLVPVDDVAEAIRLCISNPTSLGKIYNVVHPDTLTKQEYLRQYMASHGRGLTLWMPYHAVYLGVSALELFSKLLNRKPPITRYRIMASQKDVVFDSARIVSDLGWTPKWALDDLLQRTFQPSQREGL